MLWWVRADSMYVGALSRCASSVGNSHEDTGTDRLCTVEAGVGSFCIRLPEVRDLCYCVSNLWYCVSNFCNCVSNLCYCVSNLCYCVCRIKTDLVILCVISVKTDVFIVRVNIRGGDSHVLKEIVRICHTL
jgi:hypothetical protein